MENEKKGSGSRDISISERKRMAYIKARRHVKIENAWESLAGLYEKQCIRLERLSRMKMHRAMKI